MKTQDSFTPALDTLEISMLERELRAQAQVAAAKAVTRAMRRTIAKVRHAFGGRQAPSGLPSAT
jgi:hypothetical protein